MASFLSGPAAQLVGAGMQAVGLGIPVGQSSAKLINGLRDCGLPVPPKSWFKRKDAEAQEPQPPARDERASRTVYDKLESHINGVMQVVKPAIELKRLVRENCCRSAERARRARSPSPSRSVYYTPQKCSSAGRGRRRCASGSSDEEARCLGCSRSRSLLKLPCGGLICRGCDEAGDHGSECKRCRAAGKCRDCC